MLAITVGNNLHSLFYYQVSDYRNCILVSLHKQLMTTQTVGEAKNICFSLVFVLSEKSLAMLIRVAILNTDIALLVSCNKRVKCIKQTNPTIRGVKFLWLEKERQF